MISIVSQGGREDVVAVVVLDLTAVRVVGEEEEEGNEGKEGVVEEITTITPGAPMTEAGTLGQR
jgi:hypothetical protein